MMRAPCRRCLVLPACKNQCSNLKGYRKRVRIITKIILLIGIIGPLVVTWVLGQYGIHMKLGSPTAILLLIVIALSEALYFTGSDHAIANILTKGCP